MASKLGAMRHLWRKKKPKLFEYLNCFCWHDLKNKFYQNTTKRCGKDGNNLFKRHGLFKFPVDMAWWSKMQIDWRHCWHLTGTRPSVAGRMER
mmetsp:Transcript_15786/g.26387  ORF Transcript_15786/g.26387 Transcript_15786/m.26387 type:complete len:93 (-) Transcript_15786:32-310(-)